MKNILIFFFPFFVLAQHEEQKFSLFYENDQYNLTPTHHVLLDSLIAIPNKDLFDVHIKGFTNSIGNATYNLALSQKRAEQVKHTLGAFTIISSTGYGEIDSEDSQNRRVDVLIHLKEDHVAIAGEIIEEPRMEDTTEAVNLVSLTSPKKGDKITLEGIMFYADRDVIMDESIPALEELVTFLNHNPNVKFKLIGHICCGDPIKAGRDLKNVRTGKDNLSEARAQAVYNFLSKKGIDKRRMRYLGMAFRQPTNKGDQFDRRVEIEITSVD